MHTYKRSFKEIFRGGHRFTVLALPNTDYFKLTMQCNMGSNCEVIYKEKTGKNVYGLSHLVEHLSFKSTKHYSSKELKEALRLNGFYNAGTNTKYINYYFSTISSNFRLAVKLVLDIALNDLSRVSQEEFEMERKVVSNEARMYDGNPEYKFHRNTRTILYNKDIEDDIIGIPETIDTFELEDARELKANFLNHNDVVYNVTYDPTKHGVDEILNVIIDSIEEYEKPEVKVDLRSGYNEYINSLKLNNSDITVESKNNQILTSIIFDVSESITPKEFINLQELIPYIGRYAPSMSLDYKIREEKGLTYRINFDLIMCDNPNKTQIKFSCGVTEGDEELLVSLFKSTLALNLKEFSMPDFKDYLNKEKINVIVGNLNQNNYDCVHDYPLNHSSLFTTNVELFDKQLDNLQECLIEKYITEESIVETLTKINNLVNDGKYAISKSKKIN